MGSCQEISHGPLFPSKIIFTTFRNGDNVMTVWHSSFVINGYYLFYFSGNSFKSKLYSLTMVNSTITLQEQHLSEKCLSTNIPQTTLFFI